MQFDVGGTTSGRDRSTADTDDGSMVVLEEAGAERGTIKASGLPLPYMPTSAAPLSVIDSFLCEDCYIILNPFSVLRGFYPFINSYYYSTVTTQSRELVSYHHHYVGVK